MQAIVAVAPGPGQVSLQCPLIHPRLENLSIFEPGHNKNAGLSYRNMTGFVNPLLQRCNSLIVRDAYSLIRHLV